MSYEVLARKIIVLVKHVSQVLVSITYGADLIMVNMLRQSNVLIQFEESVWHWDG